MATINWQPINLIITKWTQTTCVSAFFPFILLRQWLLKTSQWFGNLCLHHGHRSNMQVIISISMSSSNCTKKLIKKNLEVSKDFLQLHENKLFILLLYRWLAKKKKKEKKAKSRQKTTGCQQCWKPNQETNYSINRKQKPERIKSSVKVRGQESLSSSD